MFGLKKKKEMSVNDIPVPPTPAEIAGSYPQKVVEPVKIPSGEIHKEITEPIKPPTPIPKPIISKATPKPAPIPKPIIPAPVQNIPPQPQAKPITPKQAQVIQPTPKHVSIQTPKQEKEERPFFVLKKNYHTVIESLLETDKRLNDTQPIDVLIKNKNKQDVKFEEIRIQLEDMERKLLYVDKTMFER